jgi:hypothetical protein
MWSTKSPIILTSLLLLVGGVSVATAAPFFGDSNGCTGTATWDAVHGNWYMDCGGSSCGPNNNRPCTPLTGGVPGANFTFCGCQDGNPQTPTCCYAAVDTNTGLPFGNGLCHMSQGAGTICTGFYPCQAVYKPGSTTEKVGKCSLTPPPQPVE